MAGSTLAELFIRIGVDAQGVEKDLDGVGSKIGELGEKMKELAKTLAAFAAVKKVADFLLDATKAFAEAEGAATRLDVALRMKSLDAAEGKLKSFAAEMQNLAGVSGDAVNAASAQLIAQGRNVEQTMEIIRGATALAAVSGQDFQTVMVQLSATLEGQVGRLGKIVPGLNDMTEAELRNGKAIALINAQYGQFLGNTGSTEIAMNRFTESLGDAQETIGEGVAPVVRMLADGMTALLNAFNNISPGMKTFLGILSTVGLTVLTGMAVRTIALTAAKWGLFGAEMAVAGAMAIGNPLLWAGIAAATGLVVAVGAIVYAKTQEADAYAKSTEAYRTGSAELGKNATLSEKYAAALTRMTESQLELEKRRLQSAIEVSRSEEERAKLSERLNQIDLERNARRAEAEKKATEETKKATVAIELRGEMMRIAADEERGRITAEEAARRRAAVSAQAQAEAEESLFTVMEKQEAIDRARKEAIARLDKVHADFALSLKSLSDVELEAARKSYYASILRSMGTSGLEEASKKLAAMDEELAKRMKELAADRYADAWKDVTGVLEGAKTESEKLADQMKKLRELEDKTGVVWGDKTMESKRLEALDILAVKLEAARKAEDLATMQQLGELRALYASYTESRVDDLEAARELELMKYADNEAMKKLIAEKYAKEITEAKRQEAEEQAAIEEKRRKDEEAAKNKWITDFKNKMEDVADAYRRFNDDLQKVGSALASYFNAAADAAIRLLERTTEAQLDAIDERTNKELSAKGLLEKTELERIQEELAEARAAGDEKVAAEKAEELEKLQIKQKAEEEKAKATEASERKIAQIKYQSSMAEWATNLAMAISNAALAIIQGFSQLGPIGGAIAAIPTAAATGLQIGVMMSNMPKPPAFARGTSSASPGVALVGEQGPELVRMRGGESVIPANRTRELLDGERKGDVSINISGYEAKSAMDLAREFKLSMRELAFEGAI